MVTITFTDREDDKFKRIFTDYSNPNDIIKLIENEINKRIALDNTLIFLDEIQFCPNAISSLKFFSEKLPKCYIICAGNLLGLTQSFWLVGKVDILSMTPMRFDEYILNRNETLYQSLHTNFTPRGIAPATTALLIEYYKEYQIIGGLPEVVDNYIHT
jgi:predicted AAA+ superfamily ATPase